MRLLASLIRNENALRCHTMTHQCKMPERQRFRMKFSRTLFCIPWTSGPELRTIRVLCSTLGAVALESRTECSILVGKVQDMLREARGLDNASDLDGTFFLDEFADSVQEVGGELRIVLV